MKSFIDLPYGDHPRQVLDVHLPDSDRFPVFIYFHGGGLDHGSKGTPETLMYQSLVQQGVAVVTAHYRLYPSAKAPDRVGSPAKYPDYIEDAASVVAWTLKNIASYGTATGIYVGGSSAGGYLSQMLCFDESWYAKAGVNPADIAGYIHDAGQPTSHFRVLKERGIDSRRVIIDETAPIYHIAADKTYPPMLIIVSDNDMENRYEQTMLMISTLKHFGYVDHVHMKLMHGKHCAYVNAADENGESVFGKLISQFILGQ